MLRYASYCYDSESGLYYLSARSYDPVTRQFLSKDEAKANGEESEYQYCGGDPVTSMDPSGCYQQKVNFRTDIAKISKTIDLTSYLKNVLRTNAGMAHKCLYEHIAEFGPVGGLGYQFYWFYEKVKNGAPWDVKWEATKTYSMNKYIKFDGYLISPDDFGNILYGYAGRYAGFDFPTLWAAALYHGRANNTPRDQSMELWGYGLSYLWGEHYSMPWNVNEYVAK